MFKKYVDKLVNHTEHGYEAWDILEDAKRLRAKGLMLDDEVKLLEDIAEAMYGEVIA